MAAFPFDPMMKHNPFEMWSKRGQDAAQLDLWTKPGRDAFEFWISFFPTAPLFGVEWRFADMTDPALNPFAMPGMPGTRAAAKAARPGELTSPAAADEAKPVARAADAMGEAARDATRIARDTGRAAVRTAEGVVRAGAEAAAAAVEAEARVVDARPRVGEATPQAAGTFTQKPAPNGAGDDAAAPARDAKEPAGKPTGGRATESAGLAAPAATSVAAPARPTMLLDQRPDEADDLKAIKGIGPDLERQLNGLGLYRFDQLAGMSDADLAWLDSNITRFKGRCFRDDWVGQAKSRLSR